MNPTGYACPHCDLTDKPRCCNDIDFNCYRVAQPMFVRDDLVRAVLAQQWAVAICLLQSEPVLDWGDGGAYFSRGYSSKAVHMAGALPCAVDVVAEMLGDA